MPSVRGFAECKNTDTRQTGYLPSGRRNTLGKPKTLGERAVCRVSTREHSANHAFAECLLGGTRQTASPRDARRRHYAGRDVCRVFNVRHSANTLLCRVPHCDTRQIFNKIFSSTFQTFVSFPTR